MARFTNNREVIRNLRINTGTTANPIWTNLCTTSEINFTSDLEITDFYVFCDAIQRSLVTGASLSLDTTVKLDIDNKATETILSKIHTLLASGTVAQFNNEMIKFDLITGLGVDGVTIEYTTYTVPCTMNFSDLGGSAEEEGEFSLEAHITGVAIEEASA
jgi:hypothetical protein